MLRNARWMKIGLVVFGLIACLSDEASAQFPRFHRRLFGIVPVENLARLESVQKSVSITDEQKKKIQELNVARNSEMQELFQSASGDFDAIGKGVAKMNVEYTEKLGKLLDEKQVERIHQIYLQVNNADVLQDASVVERLKITDEQSKKIASAMNEARQEIFGSFQSLQDEPEDKRLKAQAEMVNDRDKKLLAILTEDQRKDFEKAKGEALEVDLEKLPGFGQ